MIAALALLACAPTLEGRVTDASGAPVPGAILEDGGCRAVSAADGAFATRCARGRYRLRVRHPAFVDALADVDATRGAPPPVTVPLQAIPSTPGLYVVRDGAWPPLPEVALVRADDAGASRWCVREAPALALPAADLRLYDVHGADWRLFALDAEGCAYRTTRGAGAFWSFAADRREPARREPAGEGREFLDFALPPGGYVVADWYAGGFVPADAAAGTVRARGFVLGG